MWLLGWDYLYAWGRKGEFECLSWFNGLNEYVWRWLLACFDDVMPFIALYEKLCEKACYVEKMYVMIKLKHARNYYG